jgi:hypothetical protein
VSAWREAGIGLIECDLADIAALDAAVGFPIARRTSMNCQKSYYCNELFPAKGLGTTPGTTTSEFRRLASKNKFLACTNKTQDRGQSDYGDVASVFHLEGTMRAPIPTPEGLLPAQAAIIIMGCLFVFLATLWLFVITKAMIAIGIGAMALFTAGACAFAHRYALKPL